MGLINDYLQSENTGEDETISNPAITRRKRADLERQIVMADSDLRKILREKQDLDIEQRRLKKQEERIRIGRDALDKKMKKMQDDQRYFEEEIKILKKKLKVLQ
jgi:hypothetical protein